MADFTGDAGDNNFNGTTGADNFYLQIGGGEDTAIGRGGDDGFFFGATYGPGDVVDGGGGYDRVNLQGDYSGGVIFDAVNVEWLQLSSGDYDYKVVVIAECLAVDGGFNFDAASLAKVDSFNADLRASIAGQSVAIGDFAAAFTVRGGAGDETMSFLSDSEAASGLFSGGRGDDQVYFRTNDITDVRMNGGRGFDTLTLVAAGEYDFTSRAPKQFESIIVRDGATFDLTMADAMVGKGVRFVVDANLLGQTMTFDGSAETNGAYSVSGGAGDDVITGGAGADTLLGGQGADSFVYTEVSQSEGRLKQLDLIVDLSDSDTIDLSAIDANTNRGGDQAFRLVDHFTGRNGELVLTYLSGPDMTLLSGDVNGDGISDFAVRIAGDQTGFEAFVL